MHPVVGRIEASSWDGVVTESQIRTVFAPLELTVRIEAKDAQKIDLTKPIYITQED